MQKFNSAETDHIAIADLARCGHPKGTIDAIMRIPGYADAHHAVFKRHPNPPQADDADFSDLLDPLLAVCSAWLRVAYARESAALLNQLLRSHPHAPAAQGLLKTYAGDLLGGVSHKAPGILAGIEACVIQPSLTENERSALVALAHRLHPSAGLKIELISLRQRIERPSQEMGDDKGFDPAQELLALYTRAKNLDDPSGPLTEVMALVDEVAQRADPQGQQGGEINPLRRLDSLKRRHRRRLIDEQQTKMLSWLQIPTRRDAETHQCSMSPQEPVITIPMAWKAEDRHAAWQHFHQWLTWQLDDPQGLAWTDMKTIVHAVASGLQPRDWQNQLIALSCQKTLPADTRGQLLQDIITWLPPLETSIMTLQTERLLILKVHTECLRAMCLLSEAAPGQCAALFGTYRQRRQLKDTAALSRLIQTLVDVLSQPNPSRPSHALSVRWMNAYTRLDIDPDASATPAIWRVLCGFLLKHWIAMERHNPWADGVFLRALQILSTPKKGRSPLVSAVPMQAYLLFDQAAHWATPSARVDWLHQLERHCVQHTPTQELDRRQHIALRGAIRALLQIHGDPGPDLSASTDPSSAAIAVFEQWAGFLYTHINTLEPKTVSQATQRLDALIVDYQTRRSTGPQLDESLDKLIGQLMDVERIRLQSAANAD